jgi:L-ascorbate metabolism protein UlaG (beta-lactamase superfamily)
MSWRTITDILKRRPIALQLASQLGHGRGQQRWLDQINPPPESPITPDLTGWEDRKLSAVWIGHATILLRIGGKTILTDPVMSHRVGLGLWLATLGPRRHIAAALKPNQLPPLDLILISHAHFDHLDRATLVQLSKKTQVITAPHTMDLIRDLGFRRIVEISWGQRMAFDDLTITARQVKHWGARTFIDQHRGYNAYLIDSPSHRVLYSGDTAYQDFFSDINGVDLAIMGIGAYDPYIQAHATPEQAWQMAQQMRAEHVFPMHHSTFRLSHEPMHEPIERIISAAGNDSDRIVIRQVGQTWVDGEKKQGSDVPIGSPQ